MASETRAGPGRRVRFSIPMVLINAGYAALLVALAVVPAIPGAGAGVADSFAHAVIHGVQALLLFLMLKAVLSTLRALAAAWLGAAAFGLMTEALQTLRPERTAEVKDIMANGLGAAVVVAAIVVIGCGARAAGDR